jgi:hypothetical protein
MNPMEAFHELLKVQLTADQVRRGRQPFEIAGFQGSRFICAQKCTIGRTPRTTRVRLAACAKMVQHLVRHDGRLVHPVVTSSGERLPPLTNSVNRME